MKNYEVFQIYENLFTKAQWPEIWLAMNLKLVLIETRWLCQLKWNRAFRDQNDLQRVRRIQKVQRFLFATWFLFPSGYCHLDVFPFIES